MLNREEIIEILNKASIVDKECELFGALKHRYRLNPPVSAEFVRTIEKKYGFSLPDDYFRFITEIGDGGAGPDYGIEPFWDIEKKGKDKWAEEYYKDYRNSLKKPFRPRPMLPDNLDNFAIATKSAFEKEPDKYFIYKKPDDDALCIFDGFYVLGTQGCQWDFGLVVTGELCGRVLVTDNEGAYCLEANSFDEFYQKWLYRISDTERLKEDLQEQRKLLKK